MSKPTKLVIPDPLTEQYNGTEIFIQWDGHWLCFPMWLIKDLIIEWLDQKYPGPSEENAKLDRLLNWYHTMNAMAGDWKSPERFETLKDILKEELPSWVEAYKLYDLKT